MTIFTLLLTILLGEEGLKKLDYLLRVRKLTKIFNRIIFSFIAEPSKTDHLLVLALKLKYLTTSY
jgi:hypothetical protein